MFYALKLYLMDRWILITGVCAILITAAVWWYTISTVKPTENIMFLHYNVVFGTDLIGAWQKTYIPPVVTLVILITNSLVSFWFYNTNRLIGRLLIVMTLLTAGSILVGQILMLNLNL